MRLQEQLQGVARVERFVAGHLPALRPRLRVPRQVPQIPVRLPEQIVGLCSGHRVGAHDGVVQQIPCLGDLAQANQDGGVLQLRFEIARTSQHELFEHVASGLIAAETEQRQRGFVQKLRVADARRRIPRKRQDVARAPGSLRLGDAPSPARRQPLDMYCIWGVSMPSRFTGFRPGSSE